jgi:3-deoxy-D-manno-octulosonate 8-phosphate phosphatase (KDO 8-P phosphatase)
MSRSAAQISLLCLDVDGVLTDGSIAIDDLAVETKRFHVRDGTGLRLWMGLGHEVAIITGRSGMAVQHRAAELGIRHVIQGAADKGEAFAELLQQLGVEAAQVAALADDLPDLPVLRRAGYPMAVGDAVAEVRAVAAFVTVRPGGHGAVREAIEHLLKAQERWGEALEKFG